VHKAAFAFANHISHSQTSNFGTLLRVKTLVDRSRTRLRIQMLVALEINFAGWGMIMCAAMKAAQFF
jgi:hypothetical protein